ncbi:type II toxin-antitoxin system RelE/ParE family toxin [Dyella subtropica]|uniref:type II toxin-antitoxin system RelE/ParE family toxin n=1 Tax=Dyella subtropica TaxID=2992127 RepID=UPI00224F45A1|nr:type II toxin-antitoxin system RelE/ParE family toxin [Dyella subtropica]
MPAVREYIARDGRNHYAEWFNRLGAPAAAKVAGVIGRLATGNTSGLKGIANGLAEWKLDWGPGIRVYVHQDGKDLILLMGGSDKGDQQTEINAAAVLVHEYKERKKEAAKAAKIAVKTGSGKAPQDKTRKRRK